MKLLERPTMTPAVPRARGAWDLLAPLGRAFFGAIFIFSAPGHFQPETIAYASGAGVPWASVLVPLSGIIAFAGGLSAALGYRARAGAALLVVFLVPVTLTMHGFWDIADPQEAMTQRIMFMKNLSMLGAALLMVRLGSGPFSLRPD